MLTGLTQFLSFQLCQVLSPEENLSLCGNVQPDHKTHKCRFSAAGLSDQPQSFPFVKFQINVVAGGQHSAP